jgi:hypothetical protein
VIGLQKSWGNIMKVAVSFICGVVICLLVVIGVKPVLPVMANDTTGNGTISNGSNPLAKLLPDIEKIYRESLTAPFIKAQSKIYDEDIAAYYNDLMVRTGLNDPDSN